MMTSARMIRMTLPALIFVGVLLFSGCGSSSPVVATVGSEKITLDEFEESYSKNNGGWDASVASTAEDREKFLDLLLKFKLKVQEAHAQGLLRDSAIVDELDTYRVTVAETYMLDKEVIEPGVKLMYERKKEELRASQILFRVPPGAPPADTLAAYNKAMKVIGLVPKIGFDTLASAYSEDPTAGYNKGDLGFFTAGRLVPEFEEVCYSMKPGEYTTLPVRTQYGYHVIKLFARRPNPGAIRISHILLTFSRTVDDSAAVRDTVRKVYRALQEGLDFPTAVMKYSQDPGSVGRGGDIGFYERERLSPELANALFSLPTDSITEPMRFPYGFHIFKVTEKKPLSAFSEMEKEIRSFYQQQRYQAENERYVQQLRKKYTVTVEKNALATLAASFDSTKTPADSAWDSSLSAIVRKTTLITSTLLKLTGQGFVDKVNSTPDFRSFTLNSANIETILKRLVDALALEEHARRAPERYPTFAKLMQEYQDGILLYRIEQDEIWKKLLVNDSLLRSYYELTKEKYRWPDRVNFAEIYVLSDSSAKAGSWRIRYGEDFLEVAKDQTMRPGYRDKSGVWGFQAFGLNDLSRKAESMKTDSVSPPFQYQAGWSIIKVLGRDAPRMKTFEEAGPELASSYQEQAAKQREVEWIAMLRKKYGTAVNKEVLGEAFKRKNVQSN